MKKAKKDRPFFQPLQAVIGMYPDATEDSSLGANREFEDCLQREARSGSGDILFLESSGLTRSNNRLYEFVQKPARELNRKIYILPSDSDNIRQFVVRHSISLIIGDIATVSRLDVMYVAFYAQDLVHLYLEDARETYSPREIYVGSIDYFHTIDGKKYASCRLDAVRENIDPEEEDLNLNIFQPAERKKLRGGSLFYYGVYEIGGFDYRRIKLLRSKIWTKQDERACKKETEEFMKSMKWD